MTRCSGAFVAIFTLIVSVSAFAGESPWPMFRHDLKNTGRSLFTGPSTPAVKWTFQADDGIACSPSIGHNGTIYVGAGGYYGAASDSTLYALNPEDGSVKWRFHVQFR